MHIKLPCRTSIAQSVKLLLAGCILAPSSRGVLAEEAPPAATPPAAEERGSRQDELEAALVKMLSGATLEGSYTSTAPGKDAAKLASDKYTLGNVKKIGGNLWLIPARIQYGEHDVTLPITVPIHWASDTPVIVVDNVGLPVFGTVSARVMFFGDHYAGYWQHGNSGGHLFGVIRRADQDDSADTPVDDREQSTADGSSSSK